MTAIEVINQTPSKKTARGSARWNSDGTGRWCPDCGAYISPERFNATSHSKRRPDGLADYCRRHTAARRRKRYGARRKYSARAAGDNGSPAAAARINYPAGRIFDSERAAAGMLHRPVYYIGGGERLRGKIAGARITRYEKPCWLWERADRPEYVIDRMYLWIDFSHPGQLQDVTNLIKCSLDNVTFYETLALVRVGVGVIEDVHTGARL
jgi:hypothetical protein